MYAQSQMIGSQIYYNLFGVRKNKIPKQDSQKSFKSQFDLVGAKRTRLLCHVRRDLEFV